MNLQQIAADAGIPVEEVRSRWLMLRVAYWKSDFRRFCKEVVKIRAKDGDLVPLIVNSAQELLLSSAEKQLQEDQWVRILGLKSRRMGFSTMVAARGYWRATCYDRQKIYILSHEMNSSNVLFDMVSIIQDNNPFPPAVGTDNAKSLEFVKRGSSYQVATAGQKGGGRGAAVSFMHASEAAWWQNAPEHWASSMQAVDEVRGIWGVLWQEPANPLPFEKGIGKIEGWVKPPSEVWVETTSAGPLGVFFDKFMEALKGIGRYKAVFVPWTLQAEYVEHGDFTPNEESDEEGELSELEYQEVHDLTDAQMLWRRSKMHELGSSGKFRQEYPINVVEAFSGADTDSFIKPAILLRARKRKLEDPDAPLIIGVDPAGAGGDRFAVAFRRGDKCLKVMYRSRLEHDDAVAWLSGILEEYKPNRMAIDRGSMGQNIISSLKNISPDYVGVVRGVDFGGRSKAKTVNPNRAGPFNKRAEIWQDMRQWLVDGGVIPDDDDLISDLSGPKIKHRANNDFVLESKSDMKARGIRSSDLADALALTFAFQEYFSDWAKPKKQVGFKSGSAPNDAIGGSGEVKLVDRTGGDVWEMQDYDSGGGYSWMG